MLILGAKCGVARQLIETQKYTPGSEQWKVTARYSGKLQTFIAFLEHNT